MSSDDELVARAKRGDADAWRALYRDHAGRLTVWLSTRPAGDAAVVLVDVERVARRDARGAGDEDHCSSEMLRQSAHESLAG